MRKKYVIKATTYDKRGRVIAVGYNNYLRTHPKQSEWARLAGHEHKQSLHAEVAAIIRSRSKDIHKIKVERYDSMGNPKLAAPCPVCQLAIKMAKIKLVEFTVG